MILEKLVLEHQLSPSAVNVCISHGLMDLNAMLNHYQTHRTFFNLPKCGRVTNIELIKMCGKYVSLVHFVTEETPILSILDNFSEIQTAIYINYTKKQIEDLSTRAKSVLFALIGGEFSIDSFQMKFLANPKFNFNGLPQAGIKTYSELYIFQSKIISFVKKVHQIDDEEYLIALKHWDYIRETFLTNERV